MEKLKKKQKENAKDEIQTKNLKPKQNSELKNKIQEKQSSQAELLPNSKQTASQNSAKSQELTVLFEDNQIVVVIKPQNVPSAPDESGDLDMLSRVKEYVKEKYNKPGEVFLGLVHRLDRPTGGIMVFARNSKSAKRLSEMFKTHEVEKVYYAITSEPVKVRKQNLVNYLKKDEKENLVKIVPMSEKGAKRAELSYSLLQNSEKNSLLEVKILTGRSHQIRVQLAAIGCSLVGDVKYGKAKGKTCALGLWAGKLSFTHPTTKEKLTFLAVPDMTKEPWKDFNMEKYISR